MTPAGLDAAADRTRPAAALLAWTAALGAVLWLLSWMGRNELAAPPLDSLGAIDAWAAQRSTAEIVMAGVRLVALGSAWYLVALTVAGAVARLSRAHRVAGLADRATPRWVRSLLDRALGIGLAGSAALGSLAAVAIDHPSRPPTQLAGDLTPGPGTAAMTRLDGTAVMRRLDVEPRIVPGELEVELPVLGPPRAAPAPVVGPAGVPTDAEPPTWVVEPGDHLWLVAAETLEDHWGRPPADHEIDTYWRALIRLNCDLLVDPANPDLVLPGQSFRLPPLPAA